MNHPHTDDARFLELLERWQTGAFDRADERELHALTEADAFRQEAWAGFSELPEAEHGMYLARLHQRLRSKKTARRVVPFGIWAAAAALLVVVAALYFWPKMPVGDQQPIAQTMEKTANEAAPDMTASANDIADAAPPAVRDAPHPAPLPTAARPRPAEPVEEANSLDDDVVAVATETPQVEIAPAPSLTGTVQDTARPNWAETASYAQQQPAPAKPVVTAMNQAKEKAAEDVLNKPVSAPPTGVLERKKMDGDGASRVAWQVDTALPAAPVGGWAAFRTYLRDNARLTAAARNNNVSGSVRLLFSVGVDGKPGDVRVLQSLGHGCDEAAERLVRRFDWTPAGAEGVEVEVPFRR
ncbi:MAG: TonB family protein [Saprospiraceae bacterium]